MSLRAALLVLALCAASVPAHSPPGPVLTCQDPALGFYHDYVPHGGEMRIASDGNLQECGEPEPLTGWLGGISVMDGLQGDTPLEDYDGEPDFGNHHAVLFVETERAVECFGRPSLGHHASRVLALDAQGFGPAFFVAADHWPAGQGHGFECGDGVVEPCSGGSGPSGAPAPLDVVVELGAALLDGGCNPRDLAAFAPSVAEGPSEAAADFGPGADGAYRVFILDDPFAGRMAGSGHVWTVG